jgi:hypothetical protein
MLAEIFSRRGQDPPYSLIERFPGGSYGWLAADRVQVRGLVRGPVSKTKSIRMLTVSPLRGRGSRMFR